MSIRSNLCWGLIIALAGCANSYDSEYEAKQACWSWASKKQGTVESPGHRECKKEASTRQILGMLDKYCDDDNGTGLIPYGGWEDKGAYGRKGARCGEELVLIKKFRF